MKLEMKIDGGCYGDSLKTDKKSGLKSWEQNIYESLNEEIRNVEERVSKVTSGSYKGRIVKCIGVRYYFDWSFSSKRPNFKYFTYLCEIEDEGRIQEIVKGALTFL